MRFLLTNDDGIDAPGLAVLADAVGQFGAITIVAPHEHLSGCSHQVNTGRLLTLERRDEHRHALDGTPADCTRVGLLHVDADADWVIAGVNAGGNLGVDVFMSGTVAAVREATLFGKPGIAISQYHQRGGAFDWARAGEWVARVVQRLVEEPLAAGAFWNVNLPDLSDDDAREPELVFCGLDLGPLPMDYLRDGATFRYQGVYQNRPRTPGRDVDVCFGGDIAITKLLPPLHE